MGPEHNHCRTFSPCLFVPGRGRIFDAVSGSIEDMENVLRSTRVTLEMIKWEHSIFALPFALTGAVLMAAPGWPCSSVLGWILVCMVSARSAAMAFNRLVDARIDAANPRTAMRAIPAGQLSAGFVAAFTVVAAAIFVFAAAMLNRLTLELAPVALLVVLVYSYMKRVTRWSHLVLGLALGIAPSAAWIAVRGSCRSPDAAHPASSSSGSAASMSSTPVRTSTTTVRWASSASRRRFGLEGARSGQHAAPCTLACWC